MCEICGYEHLLICISVKRNSYITKTCTGTVNIKTTNQKPKPPPTPPTPPPAAAAQQYILKADMRQLTACVDRPPVGLSVFCTILMSEN